MKYNILANGELVATMQADFKDAKSPILLDDESTSYQVGDFSHRPKVAAETILLWENLVKGSHRVSILIDDEGERFVLADISIVEGV